MHRMSFQRAVDLLIRLFALGLFLSIVLNWIQPPGAAVLRDRLNRFYDAFLNPLRRYLRPLKLFRSAPVALDLTPLVLLLLIWWLVHPFLMWVFR